MSTLQEFWNEALAAELQELEDARQMAWMDEYAAVTDKVARIQETEQPEEKPMGHVEEEAWQEASSEAGEQSTDETCESHTEGKPDLEDARFVERIKQLEGRLTAHVEA